jgi:hypothetical protein
MGKPRALRNRDVVPTIPPVESLTNKRTTFDEVEETQNQRKSAKSGDSTTPAQTREIESNDINDVPEEVGADSMEVLRMKELHEKMAETLIKKSKRKKASTISLSASTVRPEADVGLDSSVFDSFEDQTGKNLSNNEFDEIDDDGKGWTIDTRRSNSRKM